MNPTGDTTSKQVVKRTIAPRIMLPVVLWAITILIVVWVIPDARVVYNSGLIVAPGSSQVAADAQWTTLGSDIALSLKQLILAPVFALAILFTTKLLIDLFNARSNKNLPKYRKLPFFSVISVLVALLLLLICIYLGVGAYVPIDGGYNVLYVLKSMTVAYFLLCILFFVQGIILGLMAVSYFKKAKKVE